MEKKRALDKILGKTFVFLLAFLTVIPLYLLVVTSLKTGAEVTLNPIGLPESFRWMNFVEAIKEGNIITAGLNSIFVTVLSVTLTVAVNAIVSYGIYKMYDKKLGIFLYSFLILAMSIPGSGLVATILLYRKLHLINSLLGLALSQIASSLPMSTFLIIGYMRSLPKEMEEAACIDGCKDWQNLVYIIIPLIRPILATIAILSFVGSWNNLMGPLILIRDDNLFTIPVGLLNFKGSYNKVDYHLLSAAMIITSLPIIAFFLAFQKNFVESLGGSLKA